MPKKNGVNPLLVLLTVLVLGGALFGNFQQFMAFRATKSKVAEEELLLSQTKLRLAKMVELEKLGEKMQGDIDTLNRLMPGVPQEDKLIVDLQSGADLWAMDFMLVRFGERVAKNGFVEMPLTITFDGRYHDLLNLLDYLKLYERAIRIEEIRLTPGKNKPPALSVNLKASTFFAGK